MLAAIFEAILQLVLELLFETVGEVLSELGFNFFDKARRSATWNPVLIGAGYAFFGALLGLLSHFVLPHYLSPILALRVAGFVISPLFMGLMVCWVSWFVARRDRNEKFFVIDKFLHGLVFGVSYSIARAFVV
jgi:VIT1/CCC1 family predicted Fe2+/Mn2+ transporter